MVVSSIKPIKKSISAYVNYIFGKSHDKEKEQNLYIIGIGNCNGQNPKNMNKILKLEHHAFPSKTRKHDAYTLVIVFSDELDPNSLKDCDRAGSITQEIVKQAYPNRSAIIAIQRAMANGLLHAHVLLNNGDTQGKALRQNGWRHLKKSLMKLRQEED